MEEQRLNDAEGGRSSVPGLSAEQLQKLLTLIKTSKASCDKLSGTSEWLLDSGASFHMTREFSKLARTYDDHPIIVNMPNGQHSIATKHGIVQLNSNIILRDVLYVPDLNCNLISIVHLINELFCTVIFTHKLCVIQDHSTRRPIGVGEQRREVFFLKDI